MDPSRTQVIRKLSTPARKWKSRLELSILATQVSSFWVKTYVESLTIQDFRVLWKIRNLAQLGVQIPPLPSSISGQYSSQR